jgi:hypothetical protein
MGKGYPHCRHCGIGTGLRTITVDGRRATLCDKCRDRVTRTYSGDPSWRWLRRALPTLLERWSEE